jgi:FkbM family methyltransferase
MKAPAGLHIRDAKIEGLGPWMWRATDYWGWEHPVREFAGLRALVLEHTPEKGVLVQAGGLMGMYPRLWAEHFANVYTWEPDPVNFYCLVANCPEPRIHKLQAALSNRAGLRAFTEGPEFNAGLGSLNGISGPVLTMRLDDLTFDRLDCIQLDCEGHEDRIIEGGWATIRKHWPVLCLEGPSEALCKTLDEAGYRVAGTHGTIPDVVFIPEAVLR